MYPVTNIIKTALTKQPIHHDQ